MDQQHLEQLTRDQLIEKIIGLQTRLEERGRWPQTINRPRQLFVEGMDDFALFLALLNRMGLDDVQIQIYEGKARLPIFLRTLLVLPGFDERVTSIGIVRDADSNPQDTFKSIQDALKQAKLPVPTRPQTPTDGDKRISVLILPDAHLTGELETLLLRAVAADPVMPCIDLYFDCVAQRVAPLPGNVVDKARVHAFLASRRKPGLRFGPAARASFLNLDDPVYDPIKEFIQSL